MKRVLFAAISATALMAGTAQAQMATALVGPDMLVTFDTKTGKQVKSAKITGMPSAVVGIDVRPADGMLYALGQDGTVATVDHTSGKATVKAKLDQTVPTGQVSVDFNPVADRMRVLGADGTSLRANVDDGKTTVDGKLNFKADDAHAGKTPKIVAGAYSNSVKGTKETALYDIDVTGAYVKQAPPNDGTLNSLGTIGMKAEMVAFDILSNGAENWGFLVSGKTLYKVDIANGKTAKATELEGLNGKPVRDIALWAN